MVDCQGEFSRDGFSSNSQPTKSDNTGIISHNSIVNCVINVNPRYDIHISLPEGKERGVPGEEDNVVREESVVDPHVAGEEEREVREASVIHHRLAGEEERDVREESVIDHRVAGEEERDVREANVIDPRMPGDEERDVREASVIHHRLVGEEERDFREASVIDHRMAGEEEGHTDREGLAQGYEKTPSQDTNSDHYSMTSSQESADLQKVMCSYAKGSPMPKPENCLLMQTSTLKASKYKLIRYFEEKVLQSYCKVVLTDDFVLCVSSGSEDVISLTVDLRRDDYKFKEDSTHILCLPNRKQLHFNHNTGSLLRKKIAQIKSHTVPLPQKSKMASDNSMRRAYSVPSKPTDATKRKSSKDTAVKVDCREFKPVINRDCSSINLSPGTGEVTESFLQVISQCPSLRGKVSIIGHHLRLTPEELQTCKANADDRRNQSELFPVFKMWMTKHEDAKCSMVTLQHVLDHCKDSETVKNSPTPADQ